MSRKTRKLIWSAPLVAALAVVGALAMFVMLGPGGALAHEPGEGTVPHLPPDPVTGISIANLDAANGGRTSLVVTWNAPTGGDPVATYRVDMSSDTRIWTNVIGGEMSSETLTELDAMGNCPGDSGKRCYTVTGLDPNTEYHFRVFAMNDFGTSPISINETFGTGRTLALDPPSPVENLTATTDFEDQIVLTWNAPAFDGGADVLWYCIGVANSPTGAFDDLRAAGNEADCLDATEATTAAVADGVGTPPRTIVIAATDDDGNPVTTYTHAGLDMPDIIHLRYSLDVVTEDEAGNRRISRASSNIAAGRTVAAPDAVAPQEVRPAAVQNLRVVAFVNHDSDAAAQGNVEVYFYWNTPSNYPEDGPARDWVPAVQRVVPDGSGGAVWQDVVGFSTPATLPTRTDYSTPQFAVENDVANAPNAPNLTGNDPDSGRFRVSYVNPGTGGAADVQGAWAGVEVATPITGADDRLHTTNVATSTMPIILKAANNGTPADPDLPEDLRFTRNPDDPKRRIDLRWQQNANLHADPDSSLPNGYVIDRSADGGDTWQAMRRAVQPSDLGATTSYTDSDRVSPGATYTYRVFPVLIINGPDTYGLPAEIAASSEEAAVPGPVQGLTVTADGTTALDLTWNELPASQNGGHPIEGYLVQVANDEDNDDDLDPTATWSSVGTNADGTAGNADDVYSVDAATFQYNYEPTGAAALSAGNVRWFRVIAITDENDGLDTTGGNSVNIVDGMAVAPPSPGETRPTADDIATAVPEKGHTELLGEPGPDVEPVPPARPVDITAEAASDTNAILQATRGVFLTWNEDESETAITAYAIERMRMNTGVDALNDTTWERIGIARGATSYSDPVPLRQDAETRMYRVGSVATGMPVNFADYAVAYGLHPDDHNTAPMAGDPIAAQTVMAGATVMVQSTIADADAGDTLTWSVMSDMEMYATATVSDTGMVTITGVAAGMATITVTATDMDGESASQTIAVTVETGELTAPTNVTATIDETDPALDDIVVTWTDGENAVGHMVILFRENFTIQAGDYAAAGGSATFEDVPSGTYHAVVVSYQSETEYEYVAATVTVQ